MPYQQLPITPYNPQQENPLDQYAKIAQLKGMAQQQQLGSIEIQQKQKQMASAQALDDSFKNALTVGPDGTPTFDRTKVISSLAGANEGSQVPGLIEKFNALDKSALDVQKLKDEHASASLDYMGSLANAVKEAGYTPEATGAMLAHAASHGYAPEAAQIHQALVQNPDKIKQLIDSTISQSAKQRQVSASETDAAARMKAAGKQPEGEIPLGAKVDQLNQLLNQRYQVLNPGKTAPASMQLPTNATGKDFDRIDKMLEATERSQGTAAQQATANAMRQQTYQLAQSSHEMAKQSQLDREDTQGLQPVVGKDKDGNPVLVSLSQAKQMGLSGTMKADADLVNKSHAARTWLTLASKQAPQNAPPDQMGIMQLIDKLDSEGKLGPVASRWNEFLAGKVGAGDADVAALRAKMGLSATKLMQAHVGSRGGAFMLEHFEDLANAKKMDAQTLKAGVSSELDYMKDVAMLPNNASAAASSPAASSAPKVITRAQLMQAARDNKVSVIQAESDARKQGYTIK